MLKPKNDESHDVSMDESGLSLEEMGIYEPTSDDTTPIMLVKINRTNDTDLIGVSLEILERGMTASEAMSAIHLAIRGLLSVGVKFGTSLGLSPEESIEALSGEDL